MVGQNDRSRKFLEEERSLLDDCLIIYYYYYLQLWQKTIRTKSFKRFLMIGKRNWGDNLGEEEFK